MAGIVGIAQPERTEAIRRSLGRIRHRGDNDTAVVIDRSSATMGQITPEGCPIRPQDDPGSETVCDGFIRNWQDLAPEAAHVCDAISQAYAERGPSFLEEINGPFALSIAAEDGILVARDPVGVSPLYYGIHDGMFCFASEAKALMGNARNIREFPPGHYYHPLAGFVPFREIDSVSPADMSESTAAALVKSELSEAVGDRADACEELGCWLSGGLDSSAMAALLASHSSDVKTFAVGVPGAPDLEHARSVADFVGARHHELIVTIEDLLDVLPDVIYHMESFDALLIRSSMTNYLVAKLASEHVPQVLSGEGGDELFAGYHYLKALDPEDLADELVDITLRLHNTALQRVDRCSMAHGLTAHTAFLDMSVVDLALTIPSDYKMKRNGSAVEKWILRRAMDGMLPESVLTRPKAKFWEGAGVGDLIAIFVEDVISDADFARERNLPNGATLNTKEELYYYRIFKEHFGELNDLSFVGRTKGAPSES